MTGLQYLIHDTHMMKAVLTTNERKVGAPWPSSMPMEEQPTFYSFRRQQTMWNHVGEFARWYITHKYGAWGGDMHHIWTPSEYHFEKGTPNKFSTTATSSNCYLTGSNLFGVHTSVPPGHVRSLEQYHALVSMV